MIYLLNATFGPLMLNDCHLTLFRGEAARLQESSVDKTALDRALQMGLVKLITETEYDQWCSKVIADLTDSLVDDNSQNMLKSAMRRLNKLQGFPKNGIDQFKLRTVLVDIGLLYKAGMKA